ncbi:hypothetical protein [Umezawaea sp. Da 62-37]|uniref:hypothetical protein n=1 Tax=Umezawaea sp. Da 62-37 TaxID=3075927 RepID=UPI0028F7441F|nr:hypothetical protein [Umezawaea sp. Da 62-37]WNV90540.1 hypothetical protein RM788_20325 [Umezawaea sp. Da 62-37]
MARVTVVDETTSGRTAEQWTLDVVEERLPLREVVRRRVFQEVAEFNAREGGVFRGLVRPTDAEVGLNGFRVRDRQRIDPEAQAAAALEAFGRNGFVVLVGDRQVTGLDEVVELPLGTEVTFLKLVALVGG